MLKTVSQSKLIKIGITADNEQFRCLYYQKKLNFEGKDNKMRQNTHYTESSEPLSFTFVFEF